MPENNLLGDGESQASAMFFIGGKGLKDIRENIFLNARAGI